MDSFEEKVNFHLEQDDDEWPPFPVESIWCEKIGHGFYRLNNVPYFISGLSYGDIVGVNQEGDALWFDSLVAPSGNSTVHVFCFDASKADDLRDWASENNCVLESAFKGQYFALSIPSEVPLLLWEGKLRGLESFDDDGFEFDISALRHGK